MLGSQARTRKRSTKEEAAEGYELAMYTLWEAQRAEALIYRKGR